MLCSSGELLMQLFFGCGAKFLLVICWIISPKLHKTGIFVVCALRSVMIGNGLVSYFLITYHSQNEFIISYYKSY